jgi:ribonuclease-3
MRVQTNVLADAVEALVAAVYEARGLDAARRLVSEIVREPVSGPSRLEARDPKSLLQERAQASGAPAPSYRVKSAKGPEHDPLFEVEVLVSGEVAGVGTGRSKRIAERAAASAALEKAEDPAGDETPKEPEE